MTRLRLLSFNIHGGRSRDGLRDLARVRALMDRFEVDVGIFQEMETRPTRGGAPEDVERLAGAERRYHFIGASMLQDKGWYGNLVVSRDPIVTGQVHDLQTSQRFEPRNAVDVVIHSRIGNIRIVGTHLSLSPTQRKAEARTLLKLVAEVDEEKRLPLFLMGDINEWQRPSRLLEFFDKSLRPVPCRATFPAWFPIFRLDRIWYNAPGLRVTAHRLSGKGISVLSDHLPLLVEIDR